MQGWVPWQERFLKKFQKMFFFGVSKGIAYLGGSEEATEKAIMVDVDGELVPEEVIVESIQEQSKLESKLAKREELKRIQFFVEHGAELIDVDVATRQVKVEVAIIPEDSDPKEKKVL